MRRIECRVEDGSGRRSIEAEVVVVGDDLVAVVGGGERPHVGCAVLSRPVASRSRPGGWSASSSVLTIPPHKEEPIARCVAERLAAGLGRVTVATAGVHDDDLDADGVAVYLDLGRRLADALLERLGAELGPRRAVSTGIE